jgi:hypothetical protein
VVVGLVGEHGDAWLGDLRELPARLVRAEAGIA